MRINRKGQVTIPIDIRKRLGLLPRTEVRLEVMGNAVLVTRMESPSTRQEHWTPDRMRGRATLRMSTDEIMSLTRGED